MNPRLILAILLPIVVCAVQWLLWDYLRPFAWFLFFPAAYFSAWIGGLRGGLVGTAIGALLVWYVFIPPAFSFDLDHSVASFSIVVYLVMGALFSWFFERLHRAQERSDTRFEATFEQAGLGMAMVSLDGRCLRVNDKFCETLGYSKEELLSLSIEELTHPDDRAADQEVERRLLTGEIASYSREKRTLCKEGRIVWVKLSLGLVRKSDGSPDYFISVIEDIRARKQAEEAMMESERRYRELVESANSVILHWSRDGTITYFNEFAQTLFGWRADEAIGRHVGILVPKQDSTGTDLTGLVEDIASNPERFLNTINENVCRDGRRLWMNWTNRALRDEQGLVTGILSVGNDITERERSEEELKRFNQASVGRELRMIELKRQINDLSKQLGREPPFDLSFAEDPEPPARSLAL